MSNVIDNICKKYECIGAGFYRKSITFYFKKDPKGNELIALFLGSPKIYKNIEDFSTELGKAAKEAEEIGSYRVKTIKILDRDGDTSWSGYIEYVIINKNEQSI